MFIGSFFNRFRSIVVRGSAIFRGPVSIADTLSAGVKIVTKAATGSLTAQECRGTQISTYGSSAENTQTMPEAFEGMHGTFIVGTAGVGDVHLKAAANSHFIFNGETLDDGDKITNGDPSVGDMLSFMAIQTGASTYDIIVSSGVGAWVDGGA